MATGITSVRKGKKKPQNYVSPINAERKAQKPAEPAWKTIEQRSKTGWAEANYPDATKVEFMPNGKVNYNGEELSAEEYKALSRSTVGGGDVTQNVRDIQQQQEVQRRQEIASKQGQYEAQVEVAKQQAVSQLGEQFLQPALQQAPAQAAEMANMVDQGAAQQTLMTPSTQATSILGSPLLGGIGAVWGSPIQKINDFANSHPISYLFSTIGAGALATYGDTLLTSSLVDTSGAATPRQLEYLKSLGGKATKGMTKEAASKAITEAGGYSLEGMAASPALNLAASIFNSVKKMNTFTKLLIGGTGITYLNRKLSEAGSVVSEQESQINELIRQVKIPPAQGGIDYNEANLAMDEIEASMLEARDSVKFITNNNILLWLSFGKDNLQKMNNVIDSIPAKRLELREAAKQGAMLTYG